MDIIGRKHIGVFCLLLSVFGAFAHIGASIAGNRVDRIEIIRLPPDIRGGQAYRLVYDVPIAINILWRFKTSFDNTFLEKNRYIAKHRFVSSKENVVITENHYSVAPEALFRWRTHVFPKRQRLEFRLINSSSEGRHGHKFHYGYIQLTSLGRSTRVTQVAYFDFWGAGLWAWYPWSGGMQEFLEYTAKWERKEAIRFKQRLVRSSNVN